MLEGEEGLDAVIGSTAWGLGERKPGPAWASGYSRVCGASRAKALLDLRTGYRHEHRLDRL